MISAIQICRVRPAKQSVMEIKRIKNMFAAENGELKHMKSYRREMEKR
jgi:hypothetical protein